MYRMRSDPPSITGRLLDWVDSPQALSPVPESWAADRVLRRYQFAAAAALAVRVHPAGDRILSSLATVGSGDPGGDPLADTTALSGLAPRLMPIVARWRRAGVAGADLADAEADLVAECLFALRGHGNITADAVVRLAWHRTHALRRTQRSRSARMNALNPGGAEARGVEADPVARLVRRLSDALGAGAISTIEVTAIWAHASGFSIAEAASRAGCSEAAWRARRCRALRAAVRAGVLDRGEVA